MDRLKKLTKKTTSNRIDVAPSLNGIKTEGDDTEITIKFKLLFLDPAKMWNDIYTTNSLHDTFRSHLSLWLTYIFKSTTKTS